MDPIADMLTIIRNGYLANKDLVTVPYSKFKFELAKTLAKENFVGEIKKEESKILMQLLYVDRKPKVHEIKRISKLGLRVYKKASRLQDVKGGRGIYIVSTPSGLMSSKEARDKNLGGELLCRIW